MRLTGGFRDSANTVGFSGRILSSTGSATLWIARTSANIRTIIPTGITTDQIAFRIGEEREFKIISIEPAEHRLGLSLKAMTEAPKKEEATEEATEVKAE
jgi:transposase